MVGTGCCRHYACPINGDVKGKYIIDACAAPGGKTAQLIARGAKVTAVDVSEKRLERLKGNLSRLGMSADIVAADVLNWSPQAPVDGVLIDAPCSTTGTIRRRPDILTRKKSPHIRALTELQQDDTPCGKLAETRRRACFCHMFPFPC